MSKPAWRRSLAAAQVAASLALLLYLLAQIDLAQLQAAQARLSLSFLGLAVALQLAGVFVSALKWWLLLRALNQPLAYIWTVRVYQIGQFFNNFLPTMIGGDAVRVLLVRRRGGHVAAAIASVWVERLTGFVALTLIGWSGLGLSWQLLAGAPPVRLGVLFSLLVASLAVGVALGAPVGARVLARLGLPNILDWRSRLQRTAATISGYRTRRTTVAVVTALAFAYQLSWVAVHVVAARALGLEVPHQLLLLMVPVSDIVGLVPIFFNNLGAREGTFMVFLSQLGAPIASAVALAFLIFLVRLLVGCLGGVLYLLDRLRGTRFDLATDAREAPAGGARAAE
ncbi:MAG TPA: lysylphosphatidylglycerol synthase transmembrane domain-containing protein [Herpetosiphonaceae bacterium]|nr:lysylphosphatidylglycerol synthase transmembrane domain-containing protein [Herpetosiphonaceae bacterium]